MALTFDTTACNLPDDYWVPHPDFPDDSDKTDMNWRYSVIIMPGTMLTGIGELTDVTIPEFYARLNCYERLMGALGRNGDGTEHFTALEDIVKMKGLKTNVYPMETRTKWVKRMVNVNFLDSTRRDSERRLPRIMEELADQLAENLGLSS